MMSLGVFGLCQIHSFIDYLRANMTKENFATLTKTISISVATVISAGLAILTITGKVAPWTGRFYSLLDPSYAKNNIPIIASVSEHQPTTWSSFYFDLQMLVFMFPVGLYYCFAKLTDANIFIIIYGVTSVYFAGVMVRLMLVLAPVACILAGIGISSILATYLKNLEVSSSSSEKPSKAVSSRRAKQVDPSYPIKNEVATFMVALITFFFITYTFHCTWVTSEAYSSPSIVLSAKQQDGSRVIFDDFRA